MSDPMTSLPAPTIDPRDAVAVETSRLLVIAVLTIVPR
jgi:hypothetical protein